MSVAQAIQWRRTVKQYDPSKPISEEDLTAIIEAGRMAPSSLGLEVTGVVAIQNKAMKEVLATEVLMSSNIEKSLQADVLIFLTGVTPKKLMSVDFLTQRLARSWEDNAKVAEMVTHIQQSLPKKYPNDEALRRYISEQAHLTVGFMSLQAAELGIGSTIMGGLNNNLATQRLRESGLVPDDVEVHLALAIGYINTAVNNAVLPQHRISKAQFAKIV